MLTKVTRRHKWLTLALVSVLFACSPPRWGMSFHEVVTALPTEACLMNVTRKYAGVKKIERVRWPVQFEVNQNEISYDVETYLGWAQLIVLNKEKMLIVQMVGEGASRPPIYIEEQAPIFLKNLLNTVVSECVSE